MIMFKIVWPPQPSCFNVKPAGPGQYAWRQGKWRKAEFTDPRLEPVTQLTSDDMDRMFIQALWALRTQP